MAAGFPSSRGGFAAALLSFPLNGFTEYHASPRCSRKAR